MALGRKRTWKIVAVLGLLATIFIIGYSVIANNIPRRLHKMGYSENEIEIITGKLTEAEITPILENAYLPKLTELLEERAEPADFRVENLAEYIQAQFRYELAPSTTVKLVNHEDYDIGEEYTEKKVAILYSEYYAPKRRERYFSFMNHTNGAEADADEIVALVNANRDRDYYTGTEKANLENDTLMLVNKYYYLDPDFTVDLVEQDACYGNVGERMEVETYAAFKEMFQAAEADGYQLYVTSGYREYQEQEEVFASYLAEGGETYALQYAAKPGYSEHQTGLAVDVFTPGETTTSFATSPVAQWLADNAYLYGFILRYPEGKEHLTGYSYEPWHYRYVGQEAARTIAERGLTLEEYVAFLEG